MSHHFPDVRPVRIAPIMVTRKHGDHWIAFLRYEPEVWASGQTEAEAIGQLHLSHPEVLGMLQREDDLPSPEPR